jgi:hypothetical protein
MVTVLSVVGGTILVKRMVASSLFLIQKIRMSEMNGDDIIQILFLTAGGAYALPILVGGYFDRYLVPLVPFLLFLNTDRLARDGVAATIRRSASAVLIIFSAVFAVAGTRDYLTWNRVRWEALAQLLQTAGVSTQDIDGGFEYNGWFLYDPKEKLNEPHNKSWWVKNDKYMIAFTKNPGFKVVKHYDYSNWMPPTIRTLFLLERDITSFK